MLDFPVTLIEELSSDSCSSASYFWLIEPSTCFIVRNFFTDEQDEEFSPSFEDDIIDNDEDGIEKEPDYHAMEDPTEYNDAFATNRHHIRHLPRCKRQVCFESINQLKKI